MKYAEKVRKRFLGVLRALSDALNDIFGPRPPSGGDVPVGIGA